MDFSNFSDNKIEITPNTKLLVIDFVNKTKLYSAIINNHQKTNDLEIAQFMNAIELCKFNYQADRKVKKQRTA